jgi:hypothetical protein
MKGDKKKKGLIVLAIIFVIIAFYFYAFFQDFSGGKKPVYGVTFSKKYAVDLEIDWQPAYLAILDQLKVSNVRLIAYWNEIEKEEDVFDYSELDWQIDQAASRGVGIILAVGRRTPRWPECHDPDWLTQLAPLAAQQQQLEFIKEVINRYKGNLNIIAWQVENEPLFAWFGECPWPSKKFLAREVTLVKALDSRPIIMTDSGEYGDWQRVASLADILGSTMYRVVWNKYVGFWDYFFVPAAAYRYKADITKFFHKNLDEVIITELQMEPWTMNKRMVELSLEDQQKSFNLDQFKDNIAYVEKTGFSEVYLWGAEYWYWLKQKGHLEIWEEAKKLWQ